MDDRARTTDFYELELGAQMVIWATRKRLHLLMRGEDDSEVARTFRFVGLEEAHSALMHVVDVLMCGSSRSLQLHGMGCPCVAPHEAALVNTLAYLQRRQEGQAAGCLDGVLCRSAVRIVLPAMRAIAYGLEINRLYLTAIHPSRPPPEPTACSVTVH